MWITFLVEVEVGAGAMVEVLGTRILLGMVSLIRIMGLEITRTLGL